VPLAGSIGMETEVVVEESGTVTQFTLIPVVIELV